MSVSLPFEWRSPRATEVARPRGSAFSPCAPGGRRPCRSGAGPFDYPARGEDLSGDSVFYQDAAGQIFHTYSTYGRGGEEFLGVYRYLDVTPQGRSEDGPYSSLADWVRPKNMYGRGGTVEGSGRYHQLACACTVHQSAAG